ncbi:hypothetical protein MJO28_005873 [Puccinia striiformis f. sp. tritici]|uniref:Uncharacterized protein n=1 Tax=Puccinia striiformis f. sp. tritici TaxID=168172 RepID=A0ACC0EFF1_9BASI|nr:hypothetical protein MJO28_005873 [Puccinia striiformis f. sp. tritici]
MSSSKRCPPDELALLQFKPYNTANHKSDLSAFIYKVEPHTKIPTKIKVDALRHLANEYLTKLKLRSVDSPHSQTSESSTTDDSSTSSLSSPVSDQQSIPPKSPEDDPAPRKAVPELLDPQSELLNRRTSSKTTRAPTQPTTPSTKRARSPATPSGTLARSSRHPAPKVKTVKTHRPREPASPSPKRTSTSKRGRSPTRTAKRKSSTKSISPSPRRASAGTSESPSPKKPRSERRPSTKTKRIQSHSPQLKKRHVTFEKLPPKRHKNAVEEEFTSGEENSLSGSGSSTSQSDSIDSECDSEPQSEPDSDDRTSRSLKSKDKKKAPVKPPKDKYWEEAIENYPKLKSAISAKPLKSALTKGKASALTKGKAVRKHGAKNHVIDIDSSDKRRYGTRLGYRPLPRPPSPDYADLSYAEEGRRDTNSYPRPKISPFLQLPPDREQSDQDMPPNNQYPDNSLSKRRRYIRLGGGGQTFAAPGFGHHHDRDEPHASGLRFTPASVPFCPTLVPPQCPARSPYSSNISPNTGLFQPHAQANPTATYGYQSAHRPTSTASPFQSQPNVAPSYGYHTSQSNVARAFGHQSSSEQPSQSNVARAFGHQPTSEPPSQSNVARAFGYQPAPEQPTQSNAARALGHQPSQSNDARAFGYQPSSEHPTSDLFDYSPQQFSRIQPSHHQTTAAADGRTPGPQPLSGPKSYDYLQHWTQPKSQNQIKPSQKPSQQGTASSSHPTFKFTSPLSGPKPYDYSQYWTQPKSQTQPSQKPSEQGSAPSLRPTFNFPKSSESLPPGQNGQTVDQPPPPPSRHLGGLGSQGNQPSAQQYRFGQPDTQEKIPVSQFGQFSTQENPWPSRFEQAASAIPTTGTLFRPTTAEPTTNNPFMSAPPPPPKVSVNFLDSKSAPPPPPHKPNNLWGLKPIIKSNPAPAQSLVFSTSNATPQQPMPFAPPKQPGRPMFDTAIRAPSKSGAAYSPNIPSPLTSPSSPAPRDSQVENLCGAVARYQICRPIASIPRKKDMDETKHVHFADTAAMLSAAPQILADFLGNQTINPQLISAPIGNNIRTHPPPVQPSSATPFFANSAPAHLLAPIPQTIPPMEASRLSAQPPAPCTSVPQPVAHCAPVPPPVAHRAPVPPPSYAEPQTSAPATSAILSPNITIAHQPASDLTSSFVPAPTLSVSGPPSSAFVTPQSAPPLVASAPPLVASAPLITASAPPPVAHALDMDSPRVPPESPTPPNPTGLTIKPILHATIEPNPHSTHPSSPKEQECGATSPPSGEGAV